MVSIRRKLSVGVMAASLAVTATPPVPAAANSVGGIVGGFVAGTIFGGMLGKHQRDREPSNHRSRDRSGPASVDAEKRDPKAHEAALASLGANKNLGVLAAVTFKSVTASAGSDDSSKIGKSSGTRTNKVDLPQTLSEFVTNVGKLLQGNQTGGDVSVVSVESSLDAIYNEAGPENLRQFEQIASETWTAEQFKVDILKVAGQQLNKFAVGNNKGMVTMTQIDKLLKASAHDVYVRTFEVWELIAMNRHIVDFDRTLWENSGPDPLKHDPGPTAPIVAQAPAGDDDSDEPVDIVAKIKAEAPLVAPVDASQSTPSKMSHIDAEMVRIALLLVDDLSGDASKGMRELTDAVRYRLTRATVDCFTRIAIRKSTQPAVTDPAPVSSPATPISADAAAPNQLVLPAPAPQSAESAADQKYIDLVNSFQRSIEKRDPKSDRDVDGECRVAANTLIGFNPVAVADASKTPPPPRDVKFLREPQPLRAVWNGSGWDNDRVVQNRSN